MTFVRRGLGLAALMILALSVVPISLTSGGVELDGLCATNDCERKAGAYCWVPDTGEMHYGYKSVIGRD